MHDELQTLKRDFDERGFVIVPNILDDAALGRLRGRLEKITGDPGAVPAELAARIFFERDHIRNNPQWYAGPLTPDEAGESIRQIEDLPLFGSDFADLICHPPLLDVLENLFGSPEFSFTMMTARPKDARVGSGIGNGNFHRDTPFEDYTEARTIVSILPLDKMTGANGGTEFIPGSHRISAEEAAREIWREVGRGKFAPEEIVSARCPAGAGIFFDTKILHAAGHNRSPHPRRTIQTEWVGEGSLPVSPVRYAFQGSKPRSKDPAYVKRIRMAFPHLYPATPAAAPVILRSASTEKLSPRGGLTS